ncbi:hypothetical protein EDB81DRAFT_862565 [Dactylonectria macrodidyma]|uniref:G-protein coupled receptors family 2 profile 2 domain-containing protein n=1 Tax=Dactylonectria macrodidyma TaxID=307937 RepID=A0A9P9D6P1_9HYPO|nr:hypothetical protein EDB81DRAFT_862565 [Dactylonectria macrodidyma]
MTKSLSLNQLDAVSAIERTCSVLSLLASVFTISTYCLSKSFHKPINRLVFYASFGNMLTNVGTMMSRTYVNSANSAGCQLQAFIIQMFMPADAFWTLAMAINVYLTFYFKFDAKRLRGMEIPYLCCCYGIPLVPAFVFIFVKNHAGQRAYGNAVLWCWIAPEWSVWRIAVFYGPIWVIMVITFFIYIRAGRTIYEKRKQLHDFSTSDPDPLSVNGEATGSLKTTEVSVTTEVMGESRSIHLQPMARRGSDAPPHGQHDTESYTVIISADSYAYGQAQDDAIPPMWQAPGSDVTSRRGPTTARRRNYDVNNAAWGYTKCAILFFTALLITWLPSSANRVYSFVHSGSTYAPLEYMSAFVLPLQGFWNTAIYIVTSWGACKNLMNGLRNGRRPDVAELAEGMRPQDGQQRTSHRPPFRSPLRPSKSYETESMTELAHSGDHSDDERRKS